MPDDRAPERRRDLFRNPTTLAAGLFEAAYSGLADLQRYALGCDSREGRGNSGNSGNPFLRILSNMLGALLEQTNYPHRHRLEEMLARHRRQQGPEDQA